MKLWYRLLKQAKVSLNIVRKARTLPHLSAYIHIFGEYDFNRTPFDPPGTGVVIHNRPEHRTSWAPHGEYGWYIELVMEHYISHKKYIRKTRAEIISDTVEFPPKKSTCKICLP